MALHDFQKHQINAAIRLDFPDPQEFISLTDLTSAVKSFTSIINQPETPNDDFFTTQNTLMNPFAILGTDHFNDKNQGKGASVGEAREHIVDFANSVFADLMEQLGVDSTALEFNYDELITKVRSIPHNDILIGPLSEMQSQAMEFFDLTRLQAAMVNNAKVVLLELGVDQDSGVIENPEIEESHLHLFLQLSKPDRREVAPLSPTELFNKIKGLSAEDASKLASPENINKARYLIRSSGLNGKQSLGIIDGTNLSALWLVPTLDEEHKQREALRKKAAASNTKSPRRKESRRNL